MRLAIKLRLLFALLFLLAPNIVLAQQSAGTIVFRTGDGVRRADFGVTAPGAWTFPGFSISQSTTPGLNGILFGNGSSQLSAIIPGASVFNALSTSANTNGGMALLNGSIAIGDCPKWSATGFQDSGVSCANNGTVNAGTANQLGYYASNGTAISGLVIGSGVFNGLTTNVGVAGSIVINGGVGGTPASIILTNGTGLPISTGLTGGGLNVLTALNSAATGTGGMVLVTSPTISNPTITGSLGGSGVVPGAALASGAAVTNIGFTPMNAAVTSLPSVTSLGALASLTVYGGGGFVINTGTPGTTTNSLYNVGGSLYFNGVALATGSSVSGTTGFLPKFTGASTLGNSNISISGATTTFNDSTASSGTGSGAVTVVGGIGVGGAGWFGGSLNTASNVNITGGSAPTFSAGQGSSWASATLGYVLGGDGATNDMTLVNASGTTVATIPHGTTNLSVVGNVSAAGQLLVTSSTASSSTTTGAAVFTGGIGVGAYSYFSGLTSTSVASTGGVESQPAAANATFIANAASSAYQAFYVTSVANVTKWIFGQSAGTDPYFYIYNAGTAATLFTMDYNTNVTNFPAGIASTSTTTGTVTVTGGIGVSGAGNFGGGVTSTGGVASTGGYLAASGIAYPTVSLNKTTSGGSNQFVGYTASSIRWNIEVGNGTAESGSNAGSNFAISRYNDASTIIDTPLLIIRSTGAVGIQQTSPVSYAAMTVGGSGTGAGVSITSGVPGTTTNVLYNNAGTLTWNGSALATGSSISGGVSTYLPVFTGASSLSLSTISNNAGTTTLNDTTASTSSTTGALYDKGGAGIAGNLNVGGIAAFSDNTTAYPSTSNSGLAVTWNFSAGGGESNLWNTYTPATGYSSFVFRQETGASSQTELADLGISGLKVLATTAATTTSTGAIVSSGGLGVAGAGYFGGSIITSGGVRINGSYLSFSAAPGSGTYSLTGDGTNTQLSAPGGSGVINFNIAGTTYGQFSTSGLTLASYATGSLGVNASGFVGVGGYRDAARDYGCDPTGSASAVTCLGNALSSGYPIQIIGKFKIDSPLNVTLTANSGMMLIGVGPQLSQLVLSGSTGTINISVQYTGSAINQVSQVVMRDFSIIESYAGAGTSSSSCASSTGCGMLNIAAPNLAGGFVGIVAPTLYMRNVSFNIPTAGSGTWNYIGLYLQDLRYIDLDYINMVGCLNASASGSAGIVFKTTNQGSVSNAPTMVQMNHININGGDYGIRFLPSGSTTGAGGIMDPQGVWITDSQIIGNNSASIYLVATDKANVEWRVSGNTTNAVGYGIYANGLGSVRFINNTIVTTGAGAGIWYVNGSINGYTSGIIESNVLFGNLISGANPIAVNVTSVGSSNGKTIVAFNSQQNYTSGYSIAGANAVSLSNY